MAVGATKTNKFLENSLSAKFLGTNKTPSYFNVGISTTTPTALDTGLGQRIPISGTEQVDDCDSAASWSGSTDATLADNTTTFKEGTGSISVAKTGGTEAFVTMDKTVTSLDWTDKDLWQWIYIEDLTDLISSGTAISIVYGSDSSNFYGFTIGVTGLSNGWNYITFNSSTATTTIGIPVDTAMDYYKINFFTDLATDTIAANRLLVDDIKLASEDDYNVSFSSGFPVVNASTLTATNQGIITSTEANGTLISEDGEFNVDDEFESHNVFTAESKGNTDIFIMKEVTKYRNKV